MSDTQSQTGILYICGTPIGNLDDVSSRLISILNSVDLILCEDTRVTHTLLQRYGVVTKTVSFNHHQEAHKLPGVIADLNNGKTIAAVSDAGTPGICDPGFQLVHAAREAGIRIEAIPGPSALAVMLSVCGIPADRFLFSGFIPKRVSDWELDCRLAQSSCMALVFFESPHRIKKTLEWLMNHFPDATVVVGKEFTKRFERVVSGTPSELLANATVEWSRGEWCGVVQFTPVTETHEMDPIITHLTGIGLTPRQIIDVGVTYLGLNKNQLYKALTQK
jgi:16S rRNA (cytidine1402-2'-O)-methyltransferase